MCILYATQFNHYLVLIVLKLIESLLLEMSFVKKIQLAHNENFNEYIKQFMEVNWEGKDFKEIKERVYKIEYIMGSTFISICSEIFFNMFIMFMIFYKSLF